jgi:hypothetical protein
MLFVPVLANAPFNIRQYKESIIITFCDAANNFYARILFFR